MGASIALSSLRAGLQVKVYDVRQDAVEELVRMGAEATQSVADLASQCDVVSVVVVDDEQVTAVVRELLEGAVLPRVVVIQSTVLPRSIITLSDEAAAKGLVLIDAAVSGGSEKARRGMLTLLVGGPVEAVQLCRTFFESIAENILHIGGTGSGVAAKIVNDVLALGGYALQLEAVKIADAYGISEDMFATAVSLSSGDSHYIRTWGRQDRLRREHTLAGTPAMYTYMNKDLMEGVVIAAERGLNVPLVAVATGLFPEMLVERDRVLTARGPAPSIPLCDICGQELAPPFRQYSVHPECRPFE
jgi:3-hydroxyisobutyrate dehydrogenase